MTEETLNEEQEALGIQFCQETFGGGNWVQTSYNRNFRKYFAAPGMTYNPTADRFEPAKPYASWVWNETLVAWEPPIAYPDDTENEYVWDEINAQWRLR